MHTDPAQPRSPPTPSPRHLQSRANTGLLVIALFSLLGMLVYFLWAGYREAVRDAEVTTRNLVQVIESRVHSDIARIDGILDFIAKEIPPEQLNQPAVVAQQVAMSARMQSLLAKFPGVAVVNIFDAGGYLRYSSSAATLPFSIADRPFFKQLQDDARIDLVFSDAIISRSTGQWSLILLRRGGCHQIGQLGRALGKSRTWVKSPCFAHKVIHSLCGQRRKGFPIIDLGCIPNLKLSFRMQPASAPA